MLRIRWQEALIFLTLAIILKITVADPYVQEQKRQQSYQQRSTASSSSMTQ